MANPKVSIIIPLHIYNQRFRDDFEHTLDIEYAEYEIIVVRDTPITLELEHEKVRVLCTGKKGTSPAEKRDIALGSCRGEICAFIDDDAFPAKNWLKNAVTHFEEQEVAAVGGPGLTPESDSLMQKAGGVVYSSILGSGKNAYRFTPKALREVDDYPAYNLLIRKSILQEIGGFDSTFYGGEDTKVCLKITDLGKKIIYDPTVIVYHHRRPLFREHLKQIENVGIHRGYFVRAYPKTSRRVFYFLPSLVSIVFGLTIILSFFFPLARAAFLAIIGGWLILGFMSALWVNKDVKVAFLAALGIIATHLTYGIAFLKGLTLKNLER